MSESVMTGRYADRDSEEDEEEMRQGVASWEWMDGAKPDEDDSENEGEDEAEQKDKGQEFTPELESGEVEAEPELEADQEAHHPHTPTPPRSSTKKPMLPASFKEKGHSKLGSKEPLVAATTSRSSSANKVTKSYPKVPAKPKRKSKSPIAKTRSSFGTRGKRKDLAKGNGKDSSKAKDIFDMDDSE